MRTNKYPLALRSLRTYFGVIKISAGFSTMEMLLAFVILVLSLTAIIGLVFGSQGIFVDSQTSSEALRKAESNLEVARANAAQDFNALNPSGPLWNDIYQESLEVEQTDFYTKKVSSYVVWQTGARNQSLRLTTVLTGWENASRGETCSSVLSGDWKHPQITNYNFAQAIADPGGSYTISSIDAHENKLYVTASDTTIKTSPTFFVFDISNSSRTPIYIGSIDNDSKVMAGLNAVKVSGRYAYAASASSYSRGQLQIIDVSVAPLQLIKTFKLPVTNSSGGSKGVGNAIFYNQGLVYLGLTKTDSEKEFNIIDVSDVSNPVLKGSFAVGNSINDIIVKGNYAYLAHPTDSGSPYIEQLTVLDISNPAAIRRVGYFSSYGAVGGNGKSLQMIGNKIYLGRTASKISGVSSDSIPEFFVIDGTNPAAIPDEALGSVPLATPESINSLIVRDYLAFFLTGTQFQVWNINNPSAINVYNPNTVSLPSAGVAMDCEGNYFLAGSGSGTNSYLSVIGPGL